MEKTFRVKPGTEKDIAKEKMRIILWVFIFATLFFICIPVSRSIITQRISSFDLFNMITLPLPPIIMYFYALIFKIFEYKFEVIVIDDLGVERRFEIEEETLTRCERFVLMGNKKTIRKKFLSWDEVVKVECLKDRLQIKNKAGLKRKLEGVISVSKNLENFEVAEQLIMKYTSGLNNLRQTMQSTPKTHPPLKQ